MDFRHLGRSGLIVSEISYGNWLTHGGQIEEDQAAACVRAALDAGITTFDTADIYTSGRAEEVLGRALRNERPEQVIDNVKAAGVTLDADLMAQIDEALLPVAVTDPAETASNAPRERP